MGGGNHLPLLLISEVKISKQEKAENLHKAEIQGVTFPGFSSSPISKFSSPMSAITWL